MAGYGNRTAPDISPSSLAPDHASTRLGLADTHDPPTYTGGAGLGNKLSHTSSTSSASSSTSPSTADDADDPPRFNTQARHGSAPYSNAGTYGSASTAGAGWGNKTAGSSEEGHGGGGGSEVLGKLVEKVGGVVRSRGMVERGRGMREGRGEGEGGPVAN